MTTNHHTVIGTGAAANASVFNSPLAQLDASITANATSITGLSSTVTTLQNSIILGGAAVTLTNGAASAAQKVVTVDSSAQFVAGCYVEYTLVGGVVERNTVDTVDSSTQITLITNIGTGGIADNSPVAVIPVGFYHAGQGVRNVLDFGAVGDGVANDTVAIQAAIALLDITDGGATGDYAGTLFFPAGTYLIDDTLTFASLRGATIYGVGHASRLLWDDGTSTKNMIEIKDCRSFRFSNLYMAINAGACNAAIKVYGTAGDGVPTHNLFENVMMDIGGAQYGFQIGGASPATDANNDFMEFHNCEIYNYLDSGVKFVTSSQAYNYLFLNCSLLGDGVNSKYAIDCGDSGQVGGFSIIGGAVFGNTVAAYRIANTGSQPVLFQGLNEEGNNRFLVAIAFSQIEINQCRLSASGVNADKILIIAGGANASLIINNCIIGDGTVGGTVALIVARVTYGSDANAAKQNRFVFTNNTIYSTLDGTTWDDWPFDNTNGCMPIEMRNNLVVVDINTLVSKRLDFNNGATGAYLELPYPFITKVGGARVVRTTNAAYPFTTFADVPPYHVFTVICDHANTFVDKSTAVTGDNLWLAGHANWTATVGSSITFYYDYDNDRFIELGRSQY